MYLQLGQPHAATWARRLAAITQGFGDVDAGDALVAVEISKRAGDTKRPVIARALKPRASAASRRSVRPAWSGAAIPSSRLPSQSALVRARGCFSAAKRSAWIARAAATRARTSALPCEAAGSTRSECWPQTLQPPPSGRPSLPCAALYFGISVLEGSF